MDYNQNLASLALYDLDNDPGETKNVINQYPEIYAELLDAAEAYRQELGDRLTKTRGSGLREPGRLGPNDRRLIWY